MSKAHDDIRIVIFSSSIHIDFARALQADLFGDFICSIWNEGVFTPSTPILASLHGDLDNYDFAVCILSPDVKIVIKGAQWAAPSANIVYEVAAASAHLGVDRTFVLIPAIEKYSIPDYIKIMNYIEYKFNIDSALIRSTMGPPSFTIKQKALKLGRRPAASSEVFTKKKLEYAGALCFRLMDGKLQFLSVQSTAGRRVIPKGKVDRDEKITDAALRFAHDEGGVRGIPFASDVFFFRHFKMNPSIEQTIAVKIIQSEAEVEPLAKFREPKWHSLEEFKSVMFFDRTYKYVREARDLLEKLEEVIREGLKPGNQAAALPYRFEDGALQFLLITSLRSKRWILPKGNIELGEAPREAALREAREEAGIVGEAGPFLLGTYQYISEGRKHLVQTFPLRVEELQAEWPDKRERRREWFSVATAVDEVKEDQLKQIMLEFSRTHQAP